MAFGATEGVDARAQDANTAPDSSTPAVAPAGAAPPLTVKSGKRPSGKKGASKAVVGLVATLPGFEMLPDGGSRFFVELTHQATVVEKRDARTLTYTIQGAHVVHRNNENILETIHFNTPVTRARLLPARSGLVFSVELRADAAPVWRMVDGEDGASTLQIDFPKGAFLPAGETDVADLPDEALPRPAGATAPPPGGAREPRAGAGGRAGGGGGGRHGRRSTTPPPASGPPGPPSGT
jgi:hypothetical protein